MSGRPPPRDTRIAAVDLAQVLAVARAHLRYPSNGMAPPPWRCADCGDAAHAPAVIDPRYCGRCAPSHYAWRICAIGRYRKVPAVIAARWENKR